MLVIEDPNASPPEELAPLKLIHSADPARTAAIICSEGCKKAIVAAEDMQSTHFADVVQRLLEVNVPVAIIPSINRLPLANATTNYFCSTDILLMQVRSNGLIMVLSPLFIVLGIAIKRASPGPLTYLQTRIGRHGKPFSCIKFRTMVSDADMQLYRWSLENPEL